MYSVQLVATVLGGSKGCLQTLFILSNVLAFRNLHLQNRLGLHALTITNWPQCTCTLSPSAWTSCTMSTDCSPKKQCKCPYHKICNLTGFDTSGLGIGKRSLCLFFPWFWNNFVHHGCTAVMSNGVPLPTTVFEKVVKCWGIHCRPSGGDVKWRSWEQDWGRIDTPAIVILWTLIEHSLK